MRTIVTVGAGQAAAVAARTLRRRGYDGRIELIGDEPHLPYQRPPLSKEYLDTGDEDDVFLLSQRWCSDNDVHVRSETAVSRIRTSDGSVELSDGSAVKADAVLIATGSTPRRLPHADGDRVLYLRTLDDARRLREHLHADRRLVVIGAGFIGSEVAATARAKGVDVVIVEALDTPLRNVLGARMGRVCADLHVANGVDLRLGETVESIRQSAHSVLVTTSAGSIEGDVVVVGVGVTPNVDVAVRSQIATDNGVLVDEFCRTSAPNVFAAGDVANHDHPVFGRRIRVEHFDNASRQGATAADNMLGRGISYRDPHWFWSDQYDVNLQYVGDSAGCDQTVVRGDIENGDFVAFFLRGGVVRAAFAVNRGAEIMAAKELVGGGVTVDERLLSDEDVDLAELATLEARA
ncbi:MAG TPA: FAD-dependent oxidoreductase [Acidothermaceae bacterium]|nr:FAD-dependent oxidoreductase [Acidothermaceae bacterium]